MQNVDKAFIGDGIEGNCRQADEGKEHAGIVDLAAALPELCIEFALFLRQLHCGQIRLESAHREGNLTKNFPVHHKHLTALKFRHPVDGGGHVGVVGAHHDDIVVVVAHGGGNRAFFQLEPAHKRLADAAGFSVPLHLSDIEYVLTQVALHHAVHHVQLHIPWLGNGNPRKRIHHLDLDGLGGF
ncbi:hypothetical protein SDC9_151967 [bioreactor metagenome]|uniref:Uncharacterized protein n=1 Tax=bioreactor metagenome TaxID=1076179 RepID=A0A645EU25_9ZZZZ